MKYFANITTAEELRNAYRAFCLTMHPDKGGNADEFKAMREEFETLKKQYQNGTTYRTTYTHTETAAERAAREEDERREREEWARWEAEERARREREEREKAERVLKAQEASRQAVKEWAHRLERVAEDKTGEKARYYRFEDKKAAAAFVATTKRNIKAVINHYFPGLKVAVSISGEIWKEKFCISWQDGPSVQALRDTCKELKYFVPSYYEPAGPYDDYGQYCEDKGSQPWREAYGEALGDIDDYDTARTLSEEGMQEAEEAAAAILSNWKNDTDHGRGTFAATLTEWVKFAEMLGAPRDQWGHIDLHKCGMSWGRYANNDRREDGHDVGDIYFSSARKLLRECFNVTRQPKAKAPEFVPKYGPTYKAIKKALGTNVFYIETKDSRKNAERELSIFEAAEKLAHGEAVSIGHRAEFDGEAAIYGTENGGSKTQQKRAAKFEAVGINLQGRGWGSIYATIKAESIKAETLKALHFEAEDIEQQRKQWEQEQQNGTQKPTTGAKDDKPTNSTQNTRTTATSDEAPAEGLHLQDIAEGVAVVGDDWKDTYYNKKQIKAHGAHWNKERKQWEATNPEDVAQLRAWFALREVEEMTEEETAQATEDVKVLSVDLSPIVEAVADLLATLGTICEEVKKYEGVTIPAETLERWKTETANGTTTTAARFAEVCACLGSLTPDSRQQFDGLGVIFWTLSEQLRNGYNPDTIKPATEYARAQLFDLIDRTQTENQARAIREALGDAA